MAGSRSAAPRMVLYKQRPNETSRQKKRKYPLATWKGGVSGIGQEPILPLPYENKSSLKDAFATAVSFIQSQESYIHDDPADSASYRVKLDFIFPRYGLSLEQESKLRELEISRLITATRTDISRNPFGSLVDETWRLDDAGFEILSKMADEIMINLAICKLDNAIAHGIFQNARIDDDRDFVFIRHIIRDYQRRKNDEKITDASDFKVRITPEQIRRLYCALVDYVTAVAARCACHNVLDEAWHSRVLASLAKCAAKLKFLACDSDYFLRQSLSLADQVGGQRFIHDARCDRAKLEESYRTSSWALEVLSSIFGELSSDNMSRLSRNTSSISTAVYRSGWKEVPILLTHNQRGEVSGTSARAALRIIQGAFHTLHQAIRTIKLAKPPECAGASDPSGRISFQLDIRRHFSANSKVKYAGPTKGNVETLVDFVSVIIPLLFMNPQLLLRLNHVPDLVTETSSISIYLGITRASIANFSAFVELKFHSGTVYVAPDVGLTRASFQPMSKFIVFKDANWQDIVESQSMIQHSVADNWVLEEKSILVSRRFFVTMTMTACGIVVVGGILAGFLVGERISGVDPFNIATFTWVLAAFIILIAKSLSVREWPWRDFLRGEVACRSVSELHTVTGVDEQEILGYLLAKDAYTILTTRGPFNILFSRRSGDGFSIDVKLELRALISSGIVVVGVATNMGPALVCLDFRRGVEGRTSINHSDGVREGECLFGCFDFPEAIYDDSDIPLQKLPESMTWTRVLGLYDREDKRFR